ncbi:MAG: class II glutamine amidotransferase [Gemmatimonadetes bacterium]|nr:class II glutamine amidotransferase [Gemmatimonadota bacterium]
MCRLTAWVGEPRPLDVLVFGGTHPLLEQAWAPRELLEGSVNADGWGVTWWSEGRMARLASSRPVWQEPDLEGVLAATRAGVGVAALRNATPGLPVDEASVPPLALDGRAFVLNGSVPDFRERHARALRSELPDPLYGRLSGVSDAETLFLMVMDEVGRGSGRGEALDAVAERVLDRIGDGGECQLAMLLADAEGLSVRLASNVERTNSLYVLEGSGLAGGGTLVASEALDGDPAWRRVGDHGRVDVGGDGVRITTPRRPGRGPAR